MVDWIILAGLLGFLVGLLAGCEVSQRRWRDNADQIQRIEWRGRLYKVEHAD